MEYSTIIQSLLEEMLSLPDYNRKVQHYLRYTDMAIAQHFQRTRDYR
jgi:hypothetical protein